MDHKPDSPASSSSSSCSSPPASLSLDTWTAVEPEPDEEIWRGPKAADDMSRDEDFFLIESYLFACAMTEESAVTEESVSTSANDKRARDGTDQGEASKRTKS